MTKAEWASKRSVWLVTRGGVFEELRMALVARPADLLPFMPQDPKPGESGVKSWAALTHAEAADPTFDAVPTKWPKRLPPGLVRGVGAVVGRTVVGGGLRYHLDDVGDPNGDETPRAPGAEIVDAAAFTEHARRLPAGAEVVERGKRP